MRGPPDGNWCVWKSQKVAWWCFSGSSLTGFSILFHQWCVLHALEHPFNKTTCRVISAIPKIESTGLHQKPLLGFDHVLTPKPPGHLDAPHAMSLATGEHGGSLLGRTIAPVFPPARIVLLNSFGFGLKMAVASTTETKKKKRLLEVLRYNYTWNWPKNIKNTHFWGCHCVDLLIVSFPWGLEP